MEQAITTALLVTLRERVRAERRRRLIIESDRAAFAVAAFLSFALLSFVVFSSI